MKIGIIICSIFVGSTLVSNVDSTFLLKGLLGNGGFNPLQDGLGIFNEFIRSFLNIFGGKQDGLNNFLDGFIKGVPSLLEGSFGPGQFGKVLGPLSQIPEQADISSILGEKLQGRADKFRLLIQLAKGFCASGKCGDSQNVGGDYQKAIGDLVGASDKNFGGTLDGFHNGLEELISSLEPSRTNEIFKGFAKFPENLDPSLFMGKDSSQSIDGLFSRKDILPLLIKYSKLKCNSGCDQS